MLWRCRVTANGIVCEERHRSDPLAKKCKDVIKGQVTYTGEHVRDGTCHFDTEQTRYAKQEPKDTGDNASPEEQAAIPLCNRHQGGHTTKLAMEKDAW